jgi:hypothetical protein
MSIPAPVNGNQNFTRTTGNSNFSEINASKLNIGGNAQAGRHLGGVPAVHTVYGYSSTAFVGTAAATVLAFNTEPNLAEATVGTDADILTLPIGAFITSAQVIHNGTLLAGAGFTGIDVGPAAWQTTNTSVFDDVTVANINSGAIALGNDGNTSLATSGSAGVTAGANVLGYTIKGAAPTAGNVVVAVSYVMVPQSAAELLGN